jgi:hypothetical protein
VGSELANLEVATTLGLLVHDNDAIDARAARASTAEGDEVLHGLALALEDRFHRSVRVVADPTRNAEGSSAALNAVSEEHTLD